MVDATHRFSEHELPLCTDCWVAMDDTWDELRAEERRRNPPPAPVEAPQSPPPPEDDLDEGEAPAEPSAPPRSRRLFAS